MVTMQLDVERLTDLYVRINIQELITSLPKEMFDNIPDDTPIVFNHVSNNVSNEDMIASLESFEVTKPW